MIYLANEMREIMNIQQNYTIQKVQACDREQVIAFMMKIRNEIFPMLPPDELPLDLLHFEEYYLQGEDAVVYAAFSPEGKVLGTIGIQPYDDRFYELEMYYSHIKTAEVVKCYIDPQERRLGIGTMLFNRAKEFCKGAGYDMLYLHTHPFLPGATSFWKAKGFKERLAEDDPIWQTLHMDMKL